MLVIALIAHFVITLALFKASDVFTNDLEIQPNDTKELKWCISMYRFFTAYQNVERNKQEL